MVASIDNVFGLILGIGAVIYLTLVLIFPEKF